MSKNLKLSTLNKINNKSLIIEKICPFILKRPFILYNLISIDNILKAKLNNIFSGVKINKNKLSEEFKNNLIFYSTLKDIHDELKNCYNKLNNNQCTYNFIKNELHFSFIQYLNNFIQNKFNNINIESLKGFIFDFYTTLPNISLIFLPKKKYSLESKYFNYIKTINKYSNERNKIKQNINLILIID